MPNAFRVGLVRGGRMVVARRPLLVLQSSPSEYGIAPNSLPFRRSVGSKPLGKRKTRPARGMRHSVIISHQLGLVKPLRSPSRKLMQRNDIVNNSQACGSRSDQGQAGATNVGDTERTISTAAGGLIVLCGLSRLSLSTIVAAVAGGALLYRGLTGHCSAYQALGISTACGIGNDEPRSTRPIPIHYGVAEASPRSRK